MKTIVIACFASLILVTLQAQQQQGKVIYERTVQMQIRIATDDGGGVQDNIMPRTRMDKFELSFANNQSLWKQMEQDEPDGDMMDNNSGG